ncbi:hypothetical protein CerSpe_101170 [Prunus speciosa]
MTLLLTFLSIGIDPTLLFLSVIMLYIWKGTRFLLGLKILNLSHSHSLVTTPDLSGVPNLEKLILKDCINLVVIDESLGNLEKLIFLNLKDCRSLMKLPTRIQLVYEQENKAKGVLSNSDQDITIQQEASPWRQNVLGGDVSVSASKYQLQTGKYFLCNYKDQYQFRFSSHLDFQ